MNNRITKQEIANDLRDLLEITHKLFIDFNPYLTTSKLEPVETQTEELARKHAIETEALRKMRELNKKYVMLMRLF